MPDHIDPDKTPRDPVPAQQLPVRAVGPVGGLPVREKRPDDQGSRAYSAEAAAPAAKAGPAGGLPVREKRPDDGPRLEGQAVPGRPDDQGSRPAGPSEEKGAKESPEAPSGRVQLGEYIIQERIGAGGMGQVYKASQPSLDRMIALKVLPRSVAANKEAVDRFYREAKNAAGLVHPNIVQIYTVGEDRGVPYFAMEYVVGEDLEHRLRRGEKFSVKETLGIIASTSMALACAEEHGIVHRDIKPGNIMIDTHGVVKVMDFGLAKAVKFFDTEITQAGFIVGTPTYMAPEQAEAKEVDHRTDIYSLGGVFYELLTGRSPFQSDDPATLIYMHVHREPEPPRKLRPDMPEMVERICLRCLAKKPADRYQSASGLLADLLRAEESLAGPQEDEGTIVYDMRMANLIVSSETARKPSPVRVAAAGARALEALAARETGKRPETVSWMSRYWLVVTGCAAAVLLAVVLALALGGGETEEPAGVGAPGGVGTGAGGAEAKLVKLPLSRLKNVLPPGSTVVAQFGDGPPVTFTGEALTNLADDLIDQEVPPGTVKVTASKPFYRTVERTFAVRSDGVNPPFSEELFRLEPSTELAALVGRVEGAITAGDFVKAKKALTEVRKADGESDLSGSLEEKLLAAEESHNEHWRRTHEKAEELRAKGEFDEALLLLEGMIGEIPTAHKLYAAAQGSLDRVRKMKKEIREGRVRIETLLRGGRLEEARAAVDGLVKDLGVPPERLGKLPGRIATAEKLAYEAEVALAGRRYTVARARLSKLTAITTESREYLEKLDEVSTIIERTRQAEQVIANVKEQVKEEDFEGAKRSLRRLREVDPQNRELADLEFRVRQGDAEYQIRSLLGHLASGITSARPEVVASVIDSESGRFAEGAKRSVAALAASGVSFLRSDYRLKRCELRSIGREARSVGTQLPGGRPDDAARANAVVTWTFELDVPSARRRMKGVQDLKMSLRKRPEGWRITAVEPVSRARASAVVTGGGTSDGAGVGGETRIQGRVTAVDGTVLTIDRGSKHGVKVKMMFTVYRDARVVRLPLVSRGDDDMEAVAVVEEERIGEARVVEVRKTDCLASFLPAGRRSAAPAVGMLAVRAPLLSAAGSVPEVLALAAGRPSAPMGSGVRLSADCRNVDGIPCYYRFEADGGLVVPERASVPKATWYAPHAAGEYTVKVTLVSALGVRSRTVKLRGTGPPAAGGGEDGAVASLRSRGWIEIGAPYQAVRDIAFDEAGAAYVLDERTKNLLRLSSEFEARSADPTGSAYRGKPLRIAARGGRVYVLDAGARSVRRYDLGKDPFASPPGTSYGESGVGNGKLRSPMAFALAPTGEVAVLDGGTMTVQVFGADGRFLQSVGASGGGVGGLQRPVGIVADSRGSFYVLDAGRRRVLVFRGGRHAGEFEVGTPTSELADIAYDSAGDRLLILDATRCTVTAYSTGGGRFSIPVVLPPPGGTEAKGREARIGELHAPKRIVCDGASRVYVIGGERSEFVDRFDLPRELDSPAAPSGRLSVLAPKTFARLAAAPDGKLGLLDTSTGQFWEIARGGWCVRSVGGRKIATPWSKAADVACDGEGDFYVLDPALATVHRLGREGERARFGKKGDTSKPENLLKPLAIAATPCGAAKAIAAGRGEATEQVAVLLPERRFGIHVFSADGRPEIHFPSEAASLHSSMSIAVGAGGEIHAGSSKLIESFGPTGALLRRTELEIDPTVLAASADGTLYALDARRKTVVGLDPATGRIVVKLRLPKEIRSPVGLAADGFGRLYVLDGRARKVYVWSGR